MNTFCVTFHSWFLYFFVQSLEDQCEQGKLELEHLQGLLTAQRVKALIILWCVMPDHDYCLFSFCFHRGVVPLLQIVNLFFSHRKKVVEKKKP